MESLTPNELVKKVEELVVPIDLEKSMATYMIEQKKKIVIAPVKVGRRPVKLIFNGSLTGDINVATFGSDESHSVGFTFEEASDLEALKSLNEAIFDEAQVRQGQAALQLQVQR